MGFSVLPSCWYPVSHWDQASPPLLPSFVPHTTFFGPLLSRQCVCCLNPRDYVIAEVVDPRKAAYANALGRERQEEPTAPAAKSSPAHLSELPSVGSQVASELLKAACWVGSCCILVSAKADREAQRKHSWGSCLDGNERITVSAETHSHVPAPCIASPVKLVNACLLNLPLLLLILSVTHFGLCFYFLFVWSVFPLSLFARAPSHFALMLCLL